MTRIRIEESTDESSLEGMVRRIGQEPAVGNGLSCGIIHSHSPDLEESVQRIHFLRAQVMSRLQAVFCRAGLKGLDAIVCTGGLWKKSQETIRETFLRDQIFEFIKGLFRGGERAVGARCEAEQLEQIVLGLRGGNHSFPLVLKETLSRNNLENIYYALMIFKLKFGSLPENIFAVKSDGMLVRLGKDYEAVLSRKFRAGSVNVVLLSSADRSLHNEDVELIEKRKDNPFIRMAGYLFFIMFKDNGVVERRLKGML